MTPGAKRGQESGVLLDKQLFVILGQEETPQILTWSANFLFFKTRDFEKR